MCNQCTGGRTLHRDHIVPVRISITPEIRLHSIRITTIPDKHLVHRLLRPVLQAMQGLLRRRLCMKPILMEIRRTAVQSRPITSTTIRYQLRFRVRATVPRIPHISGLNPRGPTAEVRVEKLNPSLPTHNQTTSHRLTRPIGRTGSSSQ